ncbi:MAG: hypothetical protein AAFR35_03190 [Pseudomonadota bacterium]
MKIAGFLLLLGGTVWSVRLLDLDFWSLRPVPLVINLLVFAPLVLMVAAVTLRQTAAALGRQIPLRRAVAIVAHANVAELLPIPGGALVRGAALVQAGATMGDATRMVVITAVLTLSLSVACSALAFVWLGQPIGWLLVAGGGASAAVSAVLIWRKAGLWLTTGIVAIRFVTIGLSTVAVWLSFSALAHPASLVEAALLVVSATLGTAVSIVPAGLGINEAIAAGLARLVAIDAAAAFLAVALNRVVGLAAGAALVAMLGMTGSDKLQAEGGGSPRG